MRLSSIVCLLVVLGSPGLVSAQASAPQTPASSPSAPATPAPKPAEPERSGAAGSAAPPSVAPEAAPSAEASSAVGSDAAASPAPAADGGSASTPAATAEPSLSSASSLSVPTPGELGDRLVGDLPPPPEQKSAWSAPTPVLTLHGYLRVRGELLDSLWLGRGINDDAFVTSESRMYGGVTKAGLGPDPFSAFRPFERRTAGIPCASEGTESDAVGSVCKISTLQYTSMRFRFSPQLNLSEDIRIKTTFDVLDNYVLGEAPGNMPAHELIVPRRVWAEVRNRDLGELRFGLMPDHWGLGMVSNAGNRLDDDYSTDVGRVMGTTKLAGFYLSAAYDFLNETWLQRPGTRPKLDLSQLDDTDSFTFSVVRRMPDEDEAAVLERGDVVLNAGARFQMLHQASQGQLADKMAMPARPTDTLQSIYLTRYTPDVWGQLRYGPFRLEAEASLQVGKRHNPIDGSHQRITAFGAVLESELRLLNDKLAIYIYGGFASGDSHVEGLSRDANLLALDDGHHGSERHGVVSTFEFNPSYRIDMILWRNLMGRVAGAYYAKPGISYDFVRDSFGQLFGARLDVVYSRASSFMQTWGNDPNLGVELNAQIYWRSDDGPEIDDGYHAALQYGVLFPMRGLGYYYKDSKLDTAQVLRLVLGVVY